MTYIPKSPATVSSWEELKDFLEEELQAISQEFEEPKLAVWLKPIGEPLPRPREGMVAFGQATILGASAGTYEFRGGVWVKL